MTGAVFQSIAGPADFGVAVERFRAGSDSAIPVWVGERADLAESVRRSAGLYDRLRRPPVCEVATVLGADAIPVEILALARPLAHDWTDTLPSSGEGPLLVVALDRDLRMDRFGRTLVDAYLAGRDVFLLTGRDAYSLSWMIAKQYAAAAPVVAATTALFTDLDQEPLPTGARYVDARAMDGTDVRGLTLDETWGRVLFNGHGTEDSINLGPFTVCGRHPGVRDERPGPQCAHGFGCFRPEEKLIPAHLVRAAEVVLSGCDSGALSDLATYGPGYRLMLNAIDGVAQTVVAGVGMHQSARVENRAWLAGRGGSTARLLNTSLRDLHPYPSFVQVGLPASTYPPPPPPDCGVDRAPDAGRDVDAGRDAHPVASTADTVFRELLREVSSRSRGLLAPGFLTGRHPLREPLTRLETMVDGKAVRTVLGTAESQRRFRQQLQSGLRDLDRAIASRIAGDPEDDLAGFPRFFGDRSDVADADVTRTACPCGRLAWHYLRRGLTARVPDTLARVCLSCGPIGYAFAGAARFTGTVAEPATVPAGGTFRVEAEFMADAAGPIHVGLFVPAPLRARIAPAVRRVRPRNDGHGTAVFEIVVHPAAPPQEHHYTVFAVQNLGISLLRRPFAVQPRAGEETPK